MKILNKQCVNSKWIADFLAGEEQESCECFGACKVRVKGISGEAYILTGDEISRLERLEKTVAGAMNGG